jgi:hypothetical protein
MAYKWEPWPSAPRLYIDLKHGRKTIATIKRMNGKGDKWGRKWMVVSRFACVGGMPGCYGVVFPSQTAAKQFVEGRL